MHTGSPTRRLQEWCNFRQQMHALPYVSSEIIPVEVRERMKNQMLGCEDCRGFVQNLAAVRQAYQMKTSEEIFSINKLLSGHGTGLKKLLTAAES